MPRSSDTRVSTVPALPTSGGKPEQLKVTARPVDAPALKGYDSSLTSLLSGLSQFNSGITTYLNGQADRDVDEGLKARSDGAPLDSNKGKWFEHGYMVMDGRTKGAQDGAALVQNYETKFDKDGGNVEQFIQQQWADNTKGLADKSFLTGYSQSFAHAAENLRKEHAKFQTQQVLDKHESNLLFQIDTAVRADIQSGKPVDPAKLEAMKGEFKSFFGTSGADWNDLLFKSLKRIGDDGNPTAYAMLKEKNPDGTPGMYYIPKWKTQIDAAEVHAQNVFLEKQTRMHTLLRQQREDKQDEALYGVFDKLYKGDVDGASTDFASHVKGGLFSRASDLVKWQEMVRKVENRELRPDEQSTMNEALAGVVTGKMGVRDILQLELPPKEKRQLLSEWRTAQSTERSLEAQGATAENRPFRNHAYSEQDNYIEGVLAPSQDMLGQFTHRNDFIKGARATAKLELAEHVRANGLANIREVTQKIVERHMKRLEEFDAQRLDSQAKLLRYSSATDAQAAFDRGDIDLSTLAQHVSYFESRKSQTKPGVKPNGK